MDALLTVDDAATWLGVGRRTVLSRLRDGSLNGVKLGGTRTGWRIRESDLERFVDDHATRSSGRTPATT
jgi:excisionase family DNA binding protein